MHGTAKFTGPHSLSVDLQDGSGSLEVGAKHICIATGGKPIVPDIEGAQFGITSDGFFDIEQLPKNIAIVGAGYIAVEMAGMLNAIGTEVHMFIRGETLLRSFDPMIQRTITQRYEDVGVVIHKNYSGFERIEAMSEENGNEKLLKISMGGKIMLFNELLWAIGRAPETESLGLAEAGVQLRERGFILVDEYQNTSTEGVYALGDVTGQMELTPVAIAAGRQLSNRLFGPPHFSQSSLSYSNIPTVVFAHPEIGTIGLVSETLIYSGSHKYSAQNLLSLD